jgi:cephalosporin-C deacetylase-like acetyl esterase
MVWESIRAIDYLVSRPEVDAGRLGMTGSSGGGLNTFYTSAVDERIQVSIPVCFVTTFYLMMSSERDRNWEDGMDLCNQVPGVMAYAEMWDILLLFAPKPLRIITALQDELFPVAGTRRIYDRLQSIYRLMGAEQQVDLVEVDAPHAYNQEMRQAAYGWFARWLKGEGDGHPIAEQACELLPLSHPGAYAQPRRQGLPTLASPGLCFPPGQGEHPGPAITALTQRLADGLGPARVRPSDAATWGWQRQDLLARVPAVIGFWPRSMNAVDFGQTGSEAQPLSPLAPAVSERRSPSAVVTRARIFNRVQRDDLIAERVIFESEPGIEVPGLFLMPNQWETLSPVVVYVDEWGKRAGLKNGLVNALLSAGYAVLAIDVRGWGESAASDFEAATNALMTDRPLFGQRLWDLLEAVHRLCVGGYVSGRIDRTRIGCLGRGSSGLLALYAAALDERIAAAVLWQSPLSYRTLIQERPDFPPSVFLFDVLRHFDLPDLMAAVAPRALLVAEPVDGRRQRLAQAEATALCGWPQTIYETLGVDEGKWQVQIGDDGSDDQGKHHGSAYGPIVDWLKRHL